MIGIPGVIGGASTKFFHLIRLLRDDFAITVVLPGIAFRKDKVIAKLCGQLQVPFVQLKELPRRLDGVALAMCVREFFSSGMARETKERGLKVAWSNEMMWPFEGEAEAAKAGIVDRVLYASEFQANSFRSMYENVPSAITGNYIDPDDYIWRDRRNAIFTLGRLSRDDPTKYPLDFPVFYEELGLEEVRYRIMAWNKDLQKQYCWHKFGPQWEFLAANREPAVQFLYSLDVFLYPLGHRIKESWGRSVVEAMLTGCVPVVPTGHQFHKLMVHGESGFICREFAEFKTCVRELYDNYPFRRQISQKSAAYARECLCDPAEHRRRWIEALTM